VQGLQLAVVLSTTEAQTAGVVEHLELTYPLYSDESWDIFHAYGTGHVLSAPRQAWVIIDGDGIVRWTWRSGQRGSGRTVPMPRDVLAVASELFGTSTSA
jgi:peroxiredoxin